MAEDGLNMRNRLDRYPWLLPVVMAVLALALFGDTLVIRGRVPADVASDLRTQYLYWRQFAFDEIRAGHLPLWNPYAFAGTPFLGDPQSALFYPPNWLNLFLSPERAASWLTVLHFFLAGYFTGLWCRRRGTSVAAAILAGVIYACCGPIVTNLRPGHIPLLCSAAWTPLLLMCVDSLLDGREMVKWTLVGIPAVALLALDGYPQFAYYTALASGLYAVLRLPWVKGRWRAILAIAAMFAGGWLIAAAQILPSAQWAGESVRSGGLSSNMVGTFSLPPENLLTMLVPGIFGDAANLTYYGRWYWWEACVFIGPVAVILAAYGVSRRTIIPLAVTFILFIMALGVYTPLFPLLRWLPGFNDFRATTRFSPIGLLFLAILAATGWDRLTERPARQRWAVAWAIVGAALGLAAVWATNTERIGGGGFTWLMHAFVASHQDTELWLIHPAFPGLAASFAAGQLTVAALLVLVAAGLLVSRFRQAIAVLAVGQSIYFAAGQRTSSDGFGPTPSSWRAALSALPSGERVLMPSAWLSDAGYTDGFLNVSGYNPLVLGRTARLLAAAQGDDPEQIGMNYSIHGLPPVYRMLRCGLALLGWPGGRVYWMSDPLPRLLLLDQVTQVAGADAALMTVLDGSFDSARTVVLESSPDPAPAPGNGGSARLVSETTDELEIEADLPSPRVLLVTDAYSAGWRVTPLESGAQKEYRVMPADVCLRAIPLAAGHHHFRLEYRPAAVVIGAWISLAALAAYAGAIAVYWRRSE
jgi:Bacterial membrane protein YfhO